MNNKLNLYYNITDKIQFYTVLLISLFLPLFPRLLPALIILWTLVFIASGRFREKWEQWKSKPFLSLFLIFYVIHILSLIYTSDIDKGIFDLQVKLTLLILPLLFFGGEIFSSKNYHFIMIAFIAGNLLASAYCLYQAHFTAVTYVNGHMDVDWYYFRYARMSVILHPSYFSFYLLTACYFCFYLALIRKSKAYLKIILVFIILIILIMIGLASSRAGLLAAALTVFPLIIFLPAKKIILSLLLKICMILILLGGIYYMINHNRRLDDINDMRKAEISINEFVEKSYRYNIWKTSSQVIRENFFIGVGAGDIHYELNRKYSENGMNDAVEENYNVHNQFLETFMGQGVIGLISLLCLLFYPLIIGFKKKKLLLIFFTIAVIINFFFESMLNTQAGVIFISFFLPFVFLLDKPAKISDP